MRSTTPSPPPVRQSEDLAAAARRPGREIGRAQQPAVFGNVGNDLAAIPDMVAGGDGIDPGIVELATDLVGDPEPGGGVLAVDDDEIERQLAAQSRQVAGDGSAAGASDDIAAQQDSQ